MTRHHVRRVRQERYRMKEEDREREKAELPSFFAFKLCYIPTIDDPEVHVSTYTKTKEGEIH